MTAQEISRVWDSLTPQQRAIQFRVHGLITFCQWSDLAPHEQAIVLLAHHIKENVF